MPDTATRSAPDAFAWLAAELEAVTASDEPATATAYDVTLNIRVDDDGVLHLPTASAHPMCGPAPDTTSIRPLTGRALTMLDATTRVCACIDDGRHRVGLAELSATADSTTLRAGQNARRLHAQDRTKQARYSADAAGQ